MLYVPRSKLEYRQTFPQITKLAGFSVQCLATDNFIPEELHIIINTFQEQMKGKLFGTKGNYQNFI